MQMVQIDKISHHILLLALFLDKKRPGSISEIWIPQEVRSTLEDELKLHFDVRSATEEIRSDLEKVTDERRKTYLSGLVTSLDFQLHIPKDVTTELFTRETFGYSIKRLSEEKINSAYELIRSAEKDAGLQWETYLTQEKVSPEKLRSTLKEHIDTVYQLIPEQLKQTLPKNTFRIELTNKKPWIAFNTHFKPYESKITLNTDIDFTNIGLLLTAAHESYLGHHLELCLKDRLLTKEERGEHGMLLTYSPQTFVSEGIADSMKKQLGSLAKNQAYYRLELAFQHLFTSLEVEAVFQFFDDHKTPNQINMYVSNFGLSDVQKNALLRFVTNPIWGRYAAVYHAANELVTTAMNRSIERERLLTSLYTQPWTPSMLLQLIEST